MRAWTWSWLIAVVAAIAGCGKPVDLQKALQIQELSSGWFDAGIVDGKAKLVPSVTFTVKNNSDQKLPVLQVNALFRRVTDKDEWGSGFVTAAGSEGLAAGSTTAPLTIKSPLGYTGTDQTRQEMLQNRYFVDAKVELFGKYGSAQWTRLGEYPIERKLIVP